MKINKFLILSLTFTLTFFLSCDIWKVERPTFEKSNIQEYEYKNGKNKFVLYFSRHTDTPNKGFIYQFIMGTNGHFKYLNNKKDINDETTFLVNIKAADMRIDDDKISVNIALKEKKIIIVSIPINIGNLPDDYQNKFFKIIPSDFIMNNGKRVINDTISVKLFEIAK